MVLLFYRSLSFTGKEVSFVCEAASFESITQLEIRLDAADGPCIGVCEIDHSGGWADWKEYQCGISKVSPVFSWECGTERQFTVQMSSNPKFQSAAMYLDTRNCYCIYDGVPLQAGKTYYWRGRSGGGEWEENQFTTI